MIVSIDLGIFQVGCLLKSNIFSEVEVVVAAVTARRSVYSETWRAPTPYHTHGCRSETSVYINRNDLG